MWEYSDKVKEHYKNPKNVGSIENADAIGEAGALACGDKQLVRFIHHLRDSAQTQGIRATFSYRAIMMVVKLQPKLKLNEVIAIAVFKGLDKDTVKQLVSGASLRGLGDIYSEAALEMVA